MKYLCTRNGTKRKRVSRRKCIWCWNGVKISFKVYDPIRAWCCAKLASEAEPEKSKHKITDMYDHGAKKAKCLYFISSEDYIILYAYKLNVRNNWWQKSFTGAYYAYLMYYLLHFSLHFYVAYSKEIHNYYQLERYYDCMKNTCSIFLSLLILSAKTYKEHKHSTQNTHNPRTISLCVNMTAGEFRGDLKQSY